jgi:acetyl-CoA carboxylase carboxyl transferase subunit beta
MTAVSDSQDAATDWVLCSGCDSLVYGRRFARDLRVCRQCGWHGPLTAEERVRQLADHGQFELLDLAGGVADPLGFVDVVPYTQRLAKARAVTGMDEVALGARTTIEGNPVIVAAMDFRFLGGSLGTVGGDLITQAAETALADHLPFIVVTASGGARMQEGALSLMQMAKTSAALGQLGEAGLLVVSLITDPTYGGVAASFATLADVIVAEPGARLGFAGRRVIEQTIRQELPADFQDAELLLARGFLDMIVPRARLRSEIAKLVRVGHAGGRHRADNPRADRHRSDGLFAGDPTRVVKDPGRLPESDPWGQVRLARQLDRPTSLDYFVRAFDDFQELHGDRLAGECSAVVGGTAWLDRQPVMVIGHQKGHTPAELMQRNFGMPRPAGYRKAARLMRLAEKLRLPVVTLVDTPGAYPGKEAEEQGQAGAIADNLQLMASLTVPVVAVVIGEGGSGGALALAVANQVLMFSNGVYSVISPEGCASIVWRNPGEAARAAEALRITSRDLLTLGVVDGVLPEPEGGTGAAPAVAADSLRAAVGQSLQELVGLAPRDLVAERRQRFRRLGMPAVDEAPWATDPALPHADSRHLAPLTQ